MSDAQLDVGETVRRPEDDAAQDGRYDEAHVPEHLAEPDGDQAGQHEDGAHREVPEAHDDDEVETAAAHRVDDGGLDVGEHLVRRTEGARAEDLEHYPAQHGDDQQEANTVP